MVYYTRIRRRLIALRRIVGCGDRYAILAHLSMVSSMTERAPYFYSLCRSDPAGATPQERPRWRSIITNYTRDAAARTGSAEQKRAETTACALVQRRFSADPAPVQNPRWLGKIGRPAVSAERVLTAGQTRLGADRSRRSSALSWRRRPEAEVAPGCASRWSTSD